MGEEHGLRTFPLRLLRGEHPAELGPDSEHVEEVLRDRHAAQALGLALAAEKIVANTVEREVAGNRRQRLRALAQIQHVADLGRLAGESAAVAVGNPYQAFRIREGQRPQDQRMDDAEDRGAGADAEAGDEDGESRKAGVAAQRANGVAKILEKVGEGHGLTLDGAAEAFV